MKWYNELLKRGAKIAFEVKTIEKQEADRRLAICKACEKYNTAEDQCTICGCFMEIKTGMKVHRNISKTRNEITHCPEGRWGEEDKEIANKYRELDRLDPLK